MLIAYTSLIFVSKISGLCRAAVCLICLLILFPFAAGDTEYYRHLLFDNSGTDFRSGADPASALKLDTAYQF